MTDLDLIQSGLTDPAALAALARVRRVVEGAAPIRKVVDVRTDDGGYRVAEYKTLDGELYMQLYLAALADAVDALNPDATADQGGGA